MHEPPVLLTPLVPNTQNPHLFDAALYKRAAVEYARIEEEYKRTCKLPSVPPPATSTMSADADPGGDKAPCIPPPPSERLLDDPTVWLLNSRSLQSKPARYCVQAEWAATYCSAEFPIPAEQPCPSSDARSEDSYAPSEYTLDAEDDMSLPSNDTYATDRSAPDSEWEIDEDKLEVFKLEALQAAESSSTALLSAPDALPQTSLASPASDASPQVPPASPAPTARPSLSMRAAERCARKRKAQKMKKGTDTAFEPFLSYQYRKAPTVTQAAELQTHIMNTYL
ncbi:uncharacterized protein SCHCODRAFT_01176992 [Schizophyllum commune H4-8]|nr:uncharacterized protein SCHCODRAFT_01176992 [Schizophyllum commune H4-8]KAI5886534.1 hypothetical protein SCHCODRAFT_01176992 [Schizophyllum commune H4-8]